MQTGSSRPLISCFLSVRDYCLHSTKTYSLAICFSFKLNWPFIFIVNIEKAISEVNVQSLSQSLRSQAFRMYTVLLIESKEARLALGGTEQPVLIYNPFLEENSTSLIAGASMEQEQAVQQILENVLCAVEGEKDPRGLVLSLRIIRGIQKYFPTFVYL
jgi:hypothetical protein